ncbi:MAG: hypothetical protein BWK76_06665 [Desulfobulbaceae bacterium A2]|nr:MAG: hypothetical protein BWK76_06665 [Desulfobulbaceae bacterium A2]
MHFYAITIEPRSPFGTPLKGDTIFGQFCWQAAEHGGILAGGLDHWIAEYHERPFAVFSSAWPKVDVQGSVAIRRPELPLSFLGEPDATADCAARLKNRKQNKGRRWLLVGRDFHIRLTWDNMLSDKEIYSRFTDALPADERKRLRSADELHRRPVSPAVQQHNTINRLTMTTGKGEFAPYVVENSYYPPGLQLMIFAGIADEACGPDALRECLTLMGRWGFGRDASTGLGRFDVTGVEELNLPPSTTQNDACLTLGPCVPEQDFWRAMYCTPFTRFGRHGAALLYTGKPFKNPVVMADEGAVLVPHPGQFPQKPYIGRAVGNISKAQPKAVCQGYSLFLPMCMPAQDNGGHHGSTNR